MFYNEYDFHEYVQVCCHRYVITWNFFLNTRKIITVPQNSRNLDLSKNPLSKSSFFYSIVQYFLNKYFDLFLWPNLYK